MKRRLLLVEDDPATLKALKGIYSRRGWDVLIAETLAEGLARLNETPGPDVILLDLMLPDGDGATILQRVRKAGMAVKVVVTTGVSDPARLKALEGMNPDGILQKPIQLSQLDRHLGI